MASGKPDWYKSVTMTGWTGTEYVPVLLDSTGQLYTLIKGAYGSSYLPIKLDVDGQMYVLIQGADGATKRTIAVDGTGIMLSRMKGSFGGELKDIAVDTNGNMFALMKGIDGTTLRTIAVDADGVMKANLSAQDLDYLKVRPVYGAAQSIKGYAQNFPALHYSICMDVEGKGALMGGYARAEATGGFAASQARLTIDGVQVYSQVVVYYKKAGIFGPNRGLFYLSEYSEDQGNFTICVSPGVTFETSLLIEMFNNTVIDGKLSWEFVYALVP